MPSQTLFDLYTMGSCLFGPCEYHRASCKERQPYTLVSEVPRELHCIAAHILLMPSYCDQFANASEVEWVKSQLTRPIFCTSSIESIPRWFRLQIFPSPAYELS